MWAGKCCRDYTCMHARDGGKLPYTYRHMETRNLATRNLIGLGLTTWSVQAGVTLWGC